MDCAACTALLDEYTARNHELETAQNEFREALEKDAATALEAAHRQIEVARKNVRRSRLALQRHHTLAHEKMPV
jgi:hypothetical protein